MYFLTWTRNRIDRLESLKTHCLCCVVVLVVFGSCTLRNFAANPTDLVDTGLSASDPQEAVFGMQRRIPWTTSNVRGFPDPPPPLKLVRAYPEIQIPNLIALSSIPGSDYLLAVDHRSDWGGPSRIVQFKDSPLATKTEPFLERPEIIYGLAFHPEFESNRYVFVGCNGRSEKLDAVATRVLRFKVLGDGPFQCDPESAQVIMEWEANGHNGGDLAFAGDGMLFVSAGDGTSDSDLNRTGQNVSTLTGSILRINIDERDAGKFYSIPADNPFLSVPQARPEIWAYGLRNPWRISFDRHSNELWVGNNGQDLWESVYRIERGANYGWSINESNHPFHTEQDHGPVAISPATAEHHHSEARSLTGGHVYRGKQFAFLQESYVYGDYSTGNVWALSIAEDGSARPRRIARSQLQIAGFGFDKQGELLVADHQGGIYRFARNDRELDGEFPRKLSQTGLFAALVDEAAMPGLISYEVNSPLWSDGAVKRRWMAIPDAQTIDYKPQGAWEFPEGSVLVKSFAFPSRTDGRLRRVETRLMAKQEGEWFGYSYRWNPEQTDAYLVDAEGMDETLADLAYASNAASVVKWRYPSRSECMVCHSRAANFVLGLSSEQMHRWHTYTESGKAVRAPQIESLDHIQLFGNGNIQTPQQPLVDPMDASQPLEKRVRSYLHANCSSCHVVSGGGNSKIVLSYFNELDEMQLLNENPLHGTLGLPDAKIIRPGKPESSVLLSRMSTRGAGQMPPLATQCVDAQAIDLLSEWIVSMGGKP
ncbi:MAG: PQQ-dependent sugar dehydrogenase [bacterium]|nr:PQQ-dependent sugar dehydrogenase [bacterium]